MSEKVEYTIAEFAAHVIPVWDIEKLQRLKSLIETEMLQRLLMGRQKRKSVRVNGERSE